MDGNDKTKEPPKAPREGGQDYGTRETFLQALKEAAERRKRMEGTGYYVLLPTVALVYRAEAYYNQYVEDVVRLLVSSGVEEAEIVETVVQDFLQILVGFYGNIQLPLHLQVSVVNAVKPWSLYLTERYGLNLLFSIYVYNIRTSRDYVTNFKLAEGDVTRTTRKEDGTEESETVHVGVEEQKKEYLNTTITRIASGAPLVAEAYDLMRKKQKWTEDGGRFSIIEAADFTGIEPELVNEFYSYVEVFAGVDAYANFYYIAKYALKATPEELQEIDFPPLFQTREKAQEYAEKISAARYRNLQNKAAEVEKMIDAETVEEREKARREITQEASEPQDTIRIPETFALLGSRDVYASVDGTPQMAKGILPIQAFITDYMTRHNLTEQVTPRTVEKVIEGVNLLQRLHNVKPNEKGQYTFETNISEFSELIGFSDANQTQKVEIMRALQVLDGLFLAVWRSEGLRAVRVFTIQEIGITGAYAGKLTLQVNADVMKGRPNLISYKDFDAIRKASKGQAENHFRYQIISKGQKEENALLNEVFGYDTLLKEIEVSGGTAEEIVKAKRNIEKHRSRDKQRVAKWFSEYRKKGWIIWYTHTRNGRGIWSYKWKRGNIPVEEATPSKPPQEPDDQTQG